MAVERGTVADLVQSRPSPGRTRHAILSLLLLVAAGVVWGMFYILVKVATTGGVHPIGLALWEGLAGGFILYAICIGSGHRLPVDRRHLRFYAINGLLGLTIPAVAFFAVAQRLPVGVTTLLFSLVPIMTYGVSLAARVEGLSWIRVAGILAGLAGVLFILLPEASLPDAGMSAWALLGFAAASFYALQNVYIVKGSPPGTDSLAVSCGTLLGGGLLLIPAVIATSSLYLPPLPPDAVGWSAIGIGVLSALGTLLFFGLLRFAGPVYGSQTAYTTMMSGVIMGYAIFDERLSWWVWAAIALMSAGVALVSRRR